MAERLAIVLKGLPHFSPRVLLGLDEDQFLLSVLRLLPPFHNAAAIRLGSKLFQFMGVRQLMRDETPGCSWFSWKIDSLENNTDQG